MAAHINGKDRAEVDALGFQHVPGINRATWRLTCGCGESEQWTWGVIPPNVMIRNVHRQGWLTKYRKTPTCPKCNGVHKMSVQPQIPLPQSQLGPDPKLARKIYAALDDHFDEVKRLYKGIATDATIAKEIGTSETIVARIRTEAYGELAEDPALQSARDQLEVMKLEISEWRTKMIEQASKMLAEVESIRNSLPVKRKIA